MRYTGCMLELYIVGSTLLALLALIVAIVSFRRSRLLASRLDAMLAGLSESGNLEQTLARYFSSVQHVENQLETIQKNYQHLTRIASASIQKTAIVRFNPFQRTGGDQSFVLGLLDNHDNGLLLTSIHSREGTRVYIKPVRYGSSEHTLSREEQQALEVAQSNTAKE